MPIAIWHMPRQAVHRPGPSITVVPLRTLRPHPRTCAVLGLLLGTLCVPVRGDTGLSTFQSAHYWVHTNLRQEDARRWSTHMDKVFQEYSRRFRSFGKVRAQVNRLYLFKTNHQYMDFLKSRGIAATNSGGMFVVRGDLQGLSPRPHRRGPHRRAPAVPDLPRRSRPRRTPREG